MFDFTSFKRYLSNAVRVAARSGRPYSPLSDLEGVQATAENERLALGGYNRHRAITVAASKRAAAKRRNLRKRSPH